ncbi:lysis inhibition accessory protein [Escherichia phage APTC-EC-2A]|uniref:Uncharacterized protein n=3 Tax=Tequatrovirus TaxID=10663 RepID=A0A482GF98_9CAUD|nr:hypothetical protein KMC10_gp208 [Escherichia phage vB_EcoM_G4498]QBO64531.1 hypothetical protein G29_00224 [Escherichia phage vB_EcoM_G29]QBO65903.1 hypothetical protein G4500_00227 [Escherichia phage vB_EcoM_G4500]QUL77527.1 hypothetical protein [Escherichia phage UPEC07]QZI80381.1 hypothetical protein CHD2BS1_176 [Escherichia phage vB_EcoM-CHD2BS1]QZI80824.1 hypothetical protein CHD16UKE1_177 [Escherichia phage vB_EcoM-CHD16UKE1]QZI81563.1 hypothetical protein G3F6_176 [Escherichia phag
MRIIIVLRPRQFYGVPLECYSYSGKCMLPRGDGQSGVRLKAYISISIYLILEKSNPEPLS